MNLLEIKSIIENNPVIVATVMKLNTPNIVAVTSVKVISDDSIVITDNYMKSTVENTKRIPKVIGIDISYKMLKKCSKDLRLINANAEKLPFLDNVFDTIISFTVLQDVKDIKKAVSEIRRVLKKDGNILITVLNKNKIKKIRELLKKEFKNLKEENIGKDIAFFT